LKKKTLILEGQHYRDTKNLSN